MASGIPRPLDMPVEEAYGQDDPKKAAAKEAAQSVVRLMVHKPTVFMVIAALCRY